MLLILKMVELSLKNRKMCVISAEVEKVFIVKLICDKMCSGFSQKYQSRAYYAPYQTDLKKNVLLCHLRSSEWDRDEEGLERKNVIEIVISLWVFKIYLRFSLVFDVRIGLISSLDKYKRQPKTNKDNLTYNGPFHNYLWAIYFWAFMPKELYLLKPYFI